MKSESDQHLECEGAGAPEIEEAPSRIRAPLPEPSPKIAEEAGWELEGPHVPHRTYVTPGLPAGAMPLWQALGFHQDWHREWRQFGPLLKRRSHGGRRWQLIGRHIWSESDVSPFSIGRAPMIALPIDDPWHPYACWPRRTRAHTKAALIDTGDWLAIRIEYPSEGAKVAELLKGHCPLLWGAKTPGTTRLWTALCEKRFEMKDRLLAATKNNL